MEQEPGGAVPFDQSVEPPIENTTHSFVLKFWLEHGPPKTGRDVWRGHITHVSDGERRYLRGPGDILVFASGYLQDPGLKPDLGWRLRRWLCWHARLR